MGNEVSHARSLTVGSFLVNFRVQVYGMVTTPNMKDVAEAVCRSTILLICMSVFNDSPQNHFAFSPNPWFIAAFFSGQVVLQLTWIRKLFQDKPPNSYKTIPTSAGQVGEQEQSTLNPKELKEEDDAWRVAFNYAPVYALGNLCIGGSGSGSMPRSLYSLRHMM